MTLKERWRVIRPHVLAFPLFALAKFLGLTTKFDVVGSDAADLRVGRIFTLWHGRSLLGAHFWRNRRAWIIVSHSKDGDMQAQIFRWFGFNVIRGSTGRGGVKAAVEAIDVLKKGGMMAITPDGPRGPSGIVQPGLLLMARKSGAAIIPAALSARRRTLAKSWDRFMISPPFNRAVVVYGEPIFIPKDASEEEVESIRQRIEFETHRAEIRAETLMGHPRPDWHDPGAFRPEEAQN